MEMRITRVELNQLALEIEAFPNYIREAIGSAYDANGGNFPLELLPTLTAAFTSRPALLRKPGLWAKHTLYDFLNQTAPASEDIYKLAIQSGAIKSDPPDDRIRLWGLGFRLDALKIEEIACTELYKRDYLCQQEDYVKTRSIKDTPIRTWIVESMGAVGGRKSLDCLEVIAFRLASRIPEIQCRLKTQFGIDFLTDCGSKSILSAGESALKAMLLKDYPFDDLKDKLEQCCDNPGAVDSQILKRAGDAMLSGQCLALDKEVLEAVWNAQGAIRKRLDGQRCL